MARARGESETHDLNDDETSDCTVEPERDCGSCGALWYRLDAASGRRARHAGTASGLPKRRYAIVRAVCPGRPADHDLHGPDAALRQSALSRDNGKGEKEQPRALTRESTLANSHVGIHSSADRSSGPFERACPIAQQGFKGRRVTVSTRPGEACPLRCG
jgi:hypothetical protein